MFACASHVLLLTICCGILVKAVAMDIEEVYRLLSTKVDAVETRVHSVNFEIKFLRNQVHTVSEKIKMVESMMENLDITALDAPKMIGDGTNNQDSVAIDNENDVVEDSDAASEAKIIVLRNAVINEKRYLREIETKLETLVKLVSGEVMKMSGNFSELNLRCAANDHLISQYMKTSNEQIQIAKAENIRLIKEVELLRKTTTSLQTQVDNDINQSKASIEAMQKTLDSRLDNFKDTLSTAISKEVMEHAGALTKGGRCEIGQNTVSGQDTEIMFKESFSSEPTVLKLSEDGRISITEVTATSFRIKLPHQPPPRRESVLVKRRSRVWGRRSTSRRITPPPPQTLITVKWIACV